MSSILVFVAWTDEGSDCGMGETSTGFCLIGCDFLCCSDFDSEGEGCDGERAMPSIFAPKFFMMFVKISRSEGVIVDSMAPLRASTSRALRCRKVSVVSPS